MKEVNRRTAEALAPRVTRGIRPGSETPGVLWGRPAAAAGVAVDEAAALTLSAVFAGLSRLANVQAMLPLNVHRADGRRREVAAAHPAQRLLHTAANPDQTAFQARHFMQFWKPLFGAACAEVEWDGAGRPRALWPLEPWRVAPRRDPGTGLVYYLVDGVRPVAQADMVYVPHVTEDGVTGRGFVHFAAESLGLALSADRSAGRVFANDGRPGGLLKHPGNPSREQRKELRDAWHEQHHGPENRNKVGVLWGGWEWAANTGAIAPEQAQLLESRQYSVGEVARWLNVPPHWLAELSRATFSNIEHQNLETLIYTIDPSLIALEQELDRKLLAPPGLYCRHARNALLRTDAKSRGEFYRLMREIGALTADDVLDLEEMNPVGPAGGGDRRFVPVNWQPLDAPPPVPTAPADGPAAAEPPADATPPLSADPPPHGAFVGDAHAA